MNYADQLNPMADLSNQLEVELVNLEADLGAIMPRLFLNLRLTPTNRVDLYQGEGEIEFISPDGTKSKAGPKIDFDLLRRPTINKSSNHLGSVDLDFKSLEEIEKLREGGQLTVGARVVFTGKRRNNDDMEVGSFDCEYEVSSAEWSGLLEDLEYHDNRVSQIHLGYDNAKVRDTIASAQASIERAQEKHDRGDYPGAIVDCRQAVERIRTLEDELGSLDQRKRDDLEKMLGPFEGRFLGGLAHAEEKTNITTALRRDSDFAIGITKSTIRYVGTILEEETE